MAAAAHGATCATCNTSGELLISLTTYTLGHEAEARSLSSETVLSGRKLTTCGRCLWALCEHFRQAHQPSVLTRTSQTAALSVKVGDVKARGFARRQLTSAHRRRGLGGA